MLERKCSACDFAILQDFGYSNWTVEGTTVYCSKGLHPNDEFDRWFGEDKRDKFAESCGVFQSTIGPAEIDCDKEKMDGNANPACPEAWGPYATELVTAEMLRDKLNG